jgi:ATP-dependent helicase/DNAse subunit B
MEQLIVGHLIDAGGLMLLEQLITEQLVVLEVFGQASDTSTYMEQLMEMISQLLFDHNYRS